jgi:NMD protein affecting ribosome stability and mRNA decay
MRSGYRKCLKCGQEKPHSARGLCYACYQALQKSGELQNYSLTKYGTEIELLPAREKWTYENDLGEAELAAAVALNDLKGRLKMNRHLSEDQKRRITQATSSQEIADIVAETSAPLKSEDALAERISAAASASEVAQVLAQAPRETPVSKQKREFPFVAGPDGFLIPISGGDNDR